MRLGAALNPGQTVDVARASHEPADWWCPRLGKTGGRLGSILGIETGAMGEPRGAQQGIRREPPPLEGLLYF
jgi:hypothetical protein